MLNWRKPVIKLLLNISGSNIVKYLELINKMQYEYPEKILKYQESKLKAILLHAYKNVPYYTKAFTNIGLFNNNNIVQLEKFYKIPVLTKNMIRINFEELISEDLKKRKWYYNTSGGSTGEPVRFIQDKEYQDWDIASTIFIKTFGNQDIGDKEIRLWGSERDILEGQERLSVRIRNWLYNRTEFNAFRMSEKDMFGFVERWNKIKPTWIEAYAQSMYEFARFIKEKRLEIYTPKGILTSAGTLYEKMRSLIEDVFNCRVFNRYGSRECGNMAFSCDKSNLLHINSWNHYIEILNNNLEYSKPGEYGKMYVTNLNNYSMPLIRYDIGDIAEPGTIKECACKRSIPILGKIEGREMAVFKTTSGNIVPGEFFIHFIGVVFNKGYISKFQVIQKRIDLIIIKVIITNKALFEKSRKTIEQSIKKVMGNTCEIKWEFVDEIKPLKSGKFMYTYSEIS